MRLVSVTISNFRSYREPVTVAVGDLTALIGRNDVGKSTVLEALEVFFNEQLIKIDQNDPCVHNETKVIDISCVFDHLPDELTIDARSKTTLRDEWLLNGDGLLEIVKRFDCTTKTPKSEILARAIHPTHERLADLLQLKNTDLKARAADVGANMEGVDQRSNTALRNAIRLAIANPASAERLLPLIPSARIQISR